MNLRDCKRLQVGDKFRRPSKNEHDNGWRVYTVQEIHREHGEIAVITVVDQHGYYCLRNILIWQSSLGPKEWMRTAERC